MAAPYYMKAPTAVMIAPKLPSPALYPSPPAPAASTLPPTPRAFTAPTAPMYPTSPHASTILTPQTPTASTDPPFQPKQLPPIPQPLQISIYLRPAPHRPLPILVFILPPLVRHPLDFLKTAVRPSLSSLQLHQQACHICAKKYTHDGAPAQPMQGTAKAKVKSGEIPVMLPCECVVGSKCLARFLDTTPADSCPRCGRQLFELEGAGAGAGSGAGVEVGLRKGGKIPFLGMLLEYGRRSVERGQVGGVEFDWGYVGPSEMLRLEVR